MSTPNLNLPTIPQNSLQPSSSYNPAMQLIDALLQLAVEDKDLAAPPTTLEADAGKRWIVAAAATGAWAGHVGEIALCTGADLWLFIPPREGFKAWVIDEALDYRYTSGAWGLA